MNAVVDGRAGRGSRSQSKADTRKATTGSGIAPESAAGLLDGGFDVSPLPQIVIEPYENAVTAANRAARDLMPLLASGLENVKAAALFSGSLGGLHVATQAALHSGFAWTRELKPCRSVQPAMAYRPTTHRSKKETAAGTDHGDALASDTLADAFECCLVAIVRDGRSFIHLTMIDLRAFYRRSDDDAADTLHRAGLPEWRRAESFFREIEQRHRLILSAAGEGIFGVDANGITTFVNPAAERMLGFKASEVIGRQMHSVVHHKHADGSHYPVEQCPIYNAFRAKTINTIDDEVFWRKDGKPVRVEYTSTPLVDNGTAVGAVIIFRDISERKQQEDTLRRALEENATLRERLEKENAYLQEEILTKSNHNEILGTSEATLRILRQIDVVAATDANVLITGESGTGKELVAGALHQASDRRTRPLIRVNCAAIPRELFESEFFGHVKGAFSGAIRDRVGRFELADGGTLFLDEVGEIPLDLQSKLLRVLQEGCFERVGQERTRKVDVRIIAATNRDLKSEVEKGRFREDLFFRLNVFPIECSPLRHRREDIALLARHFLRMSCRRINVPEPRISRADVESLEAYAWPGNARELQNVMERAAILSRNGRLNLNLPSGGKSSVKPADPVLPRSSEESRILTAAEMEALEIRNIESAIEACDGRVSGPMGAAHLLEMNAQTLYSRLRKLKSSRISRA